MKLIHRLGYFSVGLIMGIVILIFFLSGKKTSCNYFPNDRVLSNLRSKERHFSQQSLQFFQVNKLDTAAVNNILQTGDVDFEKSKINGKDSEENCNTYFVSGKVNKERLELQIENCDTIATLQNVKKIPETKD